MGAAPLRVTVFEMATREGTLYLRWKPRGQTRLKHESLKKSLRTKEGKIVEERRRWAKEKAQEKYEELLASSRRSESADPDDTPELTLQAGLDLVTDPKRGKYPIDTPHRREVIRSLKFAIATFGPDRTWNSIMRADLRALGRTRLDQLVDAGESGHRAAEIVVTHVIAVANWLRDEVKIDEGACIAEQYWKQKLREYWMGRHDTAREPEPFRPRHTLDEMRRILAVAPRVDPRFDLLLQLGAELRLGQVVRAWRKDIDLTENTFKVHGRGKKKAPVVEMIGAQREAVIRALTGYLRELEEAFGRGEIENYPLFPSGPLPGSRSHMFKKQKDGSPRSPHGPSEPTATVKRHSNVPPITGTTWRGWFLEAEGLADVEHVPRRGPYGVKRVSVDGAKDAGISREGLKHFGGWRDTQMPDQIYADQESAVARREARDVREKVRGSATPTEETK